MSWVDRHAILIALSTTFVCLVVLITTAVVLVSGRQEALDKARDTSENVAAALARDMSRNLQVYDLSLQAVVDGVSNPEILALPPELRRQMLFDRATMAPHVMGIYAVDEEGRIVQGRARLFPTLNLADRDYFLVHKNRDDVGLFISKPYESRLRNGSPSIALSRRISKADGSFGGVALISLDLDYFQQLVDGVKLGTHGAATIMQTDGFILARYPQVSRSKMISVASPAFLSMLGPKGGSFVAKSPVDGVERLSTFANVEDSNLVAMVAPAMDEITEEWRHRSLIIGALSVVVSCAFTIVVWLLVFAVRQRDAAQARLIAIADTDGLTGVANRRGLDATLPAMWARAVRHRLPMAIMFVDADHFKAYNDTHGHVAGDRALRFVAHCLTRRARRQNDIVARYGGEEFIVVLADCTPRRAEDVADAILTDVAACAEESGMAQPTPLAPVTVSIGVALCQPDDGTTLETAMRRADEALYDAKRDGRNRVSIVTVEANPVRKTKLARDTLHADAARRSRSLADETVK
ncbi:sensor domain-containing diguanylate cyclase [Caballeronia sp. LZ043]|uniref:sensor domain-containing diguanylate cyclase n=1 Tax=Caballeronia sp. LZ043 TaxID=3038569 RepID=UPI0028645398|nr:sensor domain-containing diguanylate cyclase [Caballeronia sp. LZ043]MDR5825711.1 sensor domain-containing diguanylate cyclase [Caballeronia sp. LZ043]